MDSPSVFIKGEGLSMQGVYPAKKKDGTEYYRSSITYKNRHISLGSFATGPEAESAYHLADSILNGEDGVEPEDYEKNGQDISFEKWIMLLNLKKTGIYCRNPIYMYGKFFLYYINRETGLKFDVEDLFFFRNHKIQSRGGHLFYSDYGMQCSLLNRYGVRGFAVKNRDYYFKNGDENDFTYGNIVVVNRYNGVRHEEYRGKDVYTVKLHMKGDVTVGHYETETEAAIAYNKAADSIEEKIRSKVNDDCINSMHRQGKTQDVAYDNGRINKMVTNDTANIDEYSVLTENEPQYKKWRRNYVENITNAEYISIYMKIRFEKSFRRYLKEL